jgi:plastocyanin
MNTKRALVLVFSFALLTAGCGGGGGNEFSLPEGAGGGAVPTGPAYDAATATATISGSIMFEGDVPEMQRIQMSADPRCIEANPSGASSQEVLVTDDSKLQNTMIFIRSGHDAGVFYAPPTTPFVLDQQACGYRPHVFTVMANQDITIRNSDPTLHNIHAFPMVNMQINVGQAVQGMENIESFTLAEGPFAIRCDVHRWMNSYTAVFDHPFHTTSADTGDYGLSVPPGTYEVVAWHEKYGEMVSTVTVGDGETGELNFTFSEADAG